MAYELLNSAQVTPPRLFALVRLVAHLQTPTREEVQNLLQPEILFKVKLPDTSITKDDTPTDDESEDEVTQNDEFASNPSRSASNNVYSAALHCQLIEPLPEGRLKVQDGVLPHLGSLKSFRQYMQKQVWRALGPDQPNYLFNLYSAWYITQNERVLRFANKDAETIYNQDMHLETPVRFNMTKFNGWRLWASFLGLGQPFKPGLSGSVREILYPDATIHLSDMLPQLFPQIGITLSASQFMQNLSVTCPALDDGELFLRCRDASHGSEHHSNYLSLALSTGLRTLHTGRVIELIRQADATDMWRLYPAGSYPHNLNEITHIRLMEQKDYGR